MQTVVTVLAIWIGYELVRAMVVRRMRRWVQRGAVEFVRRYQIQMESARFIDRLWIRERLAQDPVIDAAVARRARETGQPLPLLKQQVDEYVEEIAPYFSLSAYYRFGAALGKRVVDFCFEMVVEQNGFEEQSAHVPEGAVKVYVINHRANMDPLILAFSLLHHVPMSYAVGEWALVWPLHGLFRRFGSYFVRRGEKDPLYHVVLERFVQTIAGQGAVTGFFIEGGLSRDGALRRPRTGLLDYIIKLRREQPDREIVFLPVGLNYDRVFEDRILTAEKDGPLPKPTAVQRLFNFAGVAFWVPLLIGANVFKVALRSHKKFGYAAVWFGEPLSLTDWPGGGSAHELDDDARREWLDGLGEELLYRRIGAVVPATPVPVMCLALERQGPNDASSVRGRIQDIIRELRIAGAPMGFGEAFDSVRKRRSDVSVPAIAPDLDDRLLDAEEAELVYLLARFSMVRRRVLRKVLTPTGTGVEVVEGVEDLVSYYANSIRHHLEPQRLEAVTAG